MTKEEIIHNIEELFKKWYYIYMIDSTSMAGAVEHDELIEYCKEHMDEFKQFAEESLEIPGEWGVPIARLCDELIGLPKQEPTEEQVNWIKKELEKLNKLGKATVNLPKYSEYHIYQHCNTWLNYFKGTKDVDYYGDFVKYKGYLGKHYISWNPFKEDDPNPTYEEYVNNKDKYKI